MSSEIASIWDGWEKQVKHRRYDGKGGFCAMGWILDSRSEYSDTLRRVGAYIQRTMNPPDFWIHQNGSAYRPSTSVSGLDTVVWANNEGLLDCEGFRNIDRLTQIEAAVKPLVDSVPQAAGVAK